MQLLLALRTETKSPYLASKLTRMHKKCVTRTERERRAGTM